MERRRVLIFGLAAAFIAASHQSAWAVDDGVFKRNSVSPPDSSSEALAFSIASSELFTSSSAAREFEESYHDYYFRKNISQETIRKNHKLIEALGIILHQDFFTSIDIGDIDYLADRAIELGIVSTDQIEFIHSTDSRAGKLLLGRNFQSADVVDGIVAQALNLFDRAAKPMTIAGGLVVVLVFAFKLLDQFDNSDIA